MTCFNCRNCGSPINRKILDLGFAPPSNAYISNENLIFSKIYKNKKILFLRNN